MTIVFTNLDKSATFEDFRTAHINEFGTDFYDFSEDIPVGIISEHNDEWVKYNHNTGYVELWVDDNSNKEIIIK